MKVYYPVHFLFLTLFISVFFLIYPQAVYGESDKSGTEAVHKPFVSGYTDGYFYPQKELLRAEAFKLVAGALDISEPESVDAMPVWVKTSDWYYPYVHALVSAGILDAQSDIEPLDSISRGEFIQLVCSLKETFPYKGGTFSDITEDSPAADAIYTAYINGWINGYEDGKFCSDRFLSRAEGVIILNRVTGRKADAEFLQNNTAILPVYLDVPVGYWFFDDIMEASVCHTVEMAETTEISAENSVRKTNKETAEAVKSGNISSEIWVSAEPFSEEYFAHIKAGFHKTNAGIFYVNPVSGLVRSGNVGVYEADAYGRLTQLSVSFEKSVPYYSQIDGINAWKGCEAVSAFSGLQANGYAMQESLKAFVDGLPKAESNPEKGFVGSVYQKGRNYEKRTTIYPKALAKYCNTFCSPGALCADIRGYSVNQLKQELLAGNCVVGYFTLDWKDPEYKTFNIEGVNKQLVFNNHAVLVCGYDPGKGYLISDPYNINNRYQVYQYWKDAATVEKIWNERKTGMVIRSR